MATMSWNVFLLHLVILVLHYHGRLLGSRSQFSVQHRLKVSVQHSASLLGMPHIKMKHKNAKMQKAIDNYASVGRLFRYKQKLLNKTPEERELTAPFQIRLGKRVLTVGRLTRGSFLYSNKKAKKAMKAMKAKKA